MKNRILIAAIASTLTFSACSFNEIIPSGILVTEVRNISGFTEVFVENGLNVEIIPSTTEDVVISGSDNVVPYIETKKMGDKLIVRVKGDIWIHSNHNTKIIVHPAIIEEIDGSDFALINCPNEIINTNLSISLSGGASLIGVVKVTNLDLSLSGGSSADVKGSCIDADIDCSGGSTVKGTLLSTDDIDANLSGGSTVDVLVNKTIDISASGASIFKYTGAGIIKEQTLSGGSNVIKY